MFAATNLKLKSLRQLSNLSGLSILSYLKKRSLNRKAVVAIVALALVVTTFPLAAFLTARPAKAAWYNDDWHYRKSILFTHSGAESNVYLNLSGANALDTSASGRFQSDCGDLRFTDANGNLLPYFLVSGCGTSTTVVHVLYGTMPAGDQYLYVYYGNPNVANGTTNFDFSTAATGITFGSVGAEETSQGPVAEWKLDEGYGTTTGDSSTNGNTGTLTNGPVWQDPSMCVSGKCLQFNGTNTHVVVANATTIQNAGTLTLSAWIRPTALVRGAILSKHYNYDYDLVFETYGGLSFYQGNGSTYGNTHTGSNVIPLNTWSKIDVTRMISAGISTITFYVNGKNVGQGTVSLGPTAGTQPLWIGARPTNSEYFSGSIDDPAVYSYARTSSQIQQDYAAGLTSMNQQGGNLGNGLVGYWKMDESSWNGTAGEVKDSSGGGNNGTAVCGGTCTVPTTGMPAKFGTAAVLDGTSQAIDLGNNSNFSFNINTPFSISAWIYPSTTSASGTIFAKDTQATSRYNFGINGGKLWSNLSGTTGGGWFGGNTTLSQNQWYYVTLTYDGKGNENGVRQYVNGILDSTGPNSTLTGTMQNAVNAYIGARTTGASASFFPGSIDQVQVYNRRITPSDIQQLYNFGPPPVAAYNFDEGSGTVVHDSSGNGLDLIHANSGDCSWQPGKFGDSMHFTGSNCYYYTTDPASGVLDFGTSSFTLETWIKSSGNSSNLISKYSPGYDIEGYAANYLFRVSDGTNAPSVNFGTHATIDNNAWHHLVGVRDRGAGKLYAYLDGVLVGTASDSSSSIDNANWFSVGNGVNGNIDGVKVYNYARSQTQIFQDMNSTASALDSPVGWWKMDEGQGTTANNSGVGGSALNGTLTNMASPPTSTSGWSTAGKYGNGLNFDGTDDVVNVSNLDTTFFSRSFTVSAWAMRSDSRTQHAILSYSSMGSPLAPVDFALRGSNAYVQLNDSSGTTTTIQKGTTTTNKWYYLTATYDASASLVSLYMNGSLLGTATVASPPRTSSGALTIGRDAWNGTMLGSIDDVKIWGSALSSQDILADYNRTGGQKVGSAGTENVTTKSGATGTQPSNSKNSEYCVPGDTSSCAAPVGEWKFEEGSGTSVSDSSGNGNSGTWSGSGSHWAPGKIGTAGNFNGTDDYVNVPDPASGALDFGPNQSFSIGFWVKTTSSPTSTKPLAKFNVDSNGVGWGIWQGGGSMYLKVANGTSNLYEQSVPTINDGTWHFVEYTVTRSGNCSRYKDGVLIGTTDCSSWASTDLSNSNSLRFGVNSTINSGYWNGGLDQVRIYNYARSAAQVAWDYNKGGPVAWYKMDECSGSTVHSSTNPYNAALNGTITIGATGTQTAVGTCQASGTAWGNGASGKHGASLNFDGTDDYIGISSSSQLNFGTSTDFTLSAWVKASSVANQPFIIDNRNTYGGTNAGYTLLVDASGRPGLRLGDGTNVAGYGPSSGTYATGVWHHYAVSVSRTGTTYFYADGKKIGSANVSAIGSITTANTLHIGTKDGTVANGINGQVDDLQIFNYALTPTQISTLYNGGSAYWGQ